MPTFISSTTTKDLQIPSSNCFTCQFDTAYYHDELFEQLNIVFPTNLLKAVPKRKAEFLAGRYLARLALEQFGYNNFQIKTGDKRNPIWPELLVGTISHSKTSAFCAIAPQNIYKGLGIDHEIIIRKETAKEIKSSVISDIEDERLTAQFDSEEIFLTLAFSMKESLFKALFPNVGYYFDFSAAEVKAIDTQKKSMTLSLTQDLTPKLQKGDCFIGHYEISQSSLFTSLFY